jgi:NADH-quinone oxidoreductase subunit F
MRGYQAVRDFLEHHQRLKAGIDPQRRMVTICGGTGCTAFGSPAVRQAFQQELERRKLGQKIPVKLTGCHGFCEKGPVVVILPSQVFYPSVKVEDVPRIVEKTVLGGEVIEELLYVDPATGQKIVHDHEVPFYARQQRLVFHLNGTLDPTDLEDYIAHDGYRAMVKALSEMTPEQVIDEVREAGLRGRGGAGFPTGVKWGFCRKAPGDEKYLICNADEGDPGAFMDRSVLEGTPHAVIEGLIISAYAIGASNAIIYVRAEYPLAVKNSRVAIQQAMEAGLLGEDILGTGYSLRISVREGAGAFVCGEETALIASLEGQRGMPRPRPPFPAQSGYRGKPTTINNVETLANVPLILLRGKQWYQAIGTEKSKGTKIFALAGKVNNTGLVEVPMGATLRQIVFEIGGGIPKNRAFKAAQMGGPSGGCVPAKYLDLPIDYESVKQVGAIMGSGGLIIMDENTCVVDIARFFLEFVQKESCGKCVPCRVGTRHMYDILTRICAGQGEEGDIERLEEIALAVKASSLCGLGQTAPNPVLSTIRHFRHEYEEHIRQRHCRASVCEALVESPCSHACPAGVNVPQYLALIAENRLDDAVNLIRRRNPFVSVCGRVCEAPCESRCRRADVDEPLAIRALKRYASDHASPVVRPLSAPARGDQQVAVVGSGPAGLSCAYFLALLGRRSVVFEALPIPGGMLSVGIPEYRLPKSSLQADIDFILAHGVELRTGSRVEEVAALPAAGFKSVFVATGAHTGRPLGVEGEDLTGVVDSLLFLRARALGQPVPCGEQVAVIGGGNAAIDTARSALRLGASKVLILYRRTREEMPAYEEEIQAALEEGAELQQLVAPVRILGSAGKVTGIRMRRMRLGDADESGRRRPVEVPGAEFEVECDMVIPAIGQRPSTAAVGSLAILNDREGVAADPVTGGTSAAGVFAGGDCVSGGATVIEAIRAGQRAAVAIDRQLGGSGVLPANVGMSLRRPSEEELEKLLPRTAEAWLQLEERKKSFVEVVCGLKPDQACYEAGRCLRCDLERAESLQARRGA